MQTALDLGGLLHAILTCVTAGPGLGFNRAVVFLADEDAAELTAALAIGPATPDEAHATWAQLGDQFRSIDELLRSPPNTAPASGLQRLVAGLTIPLATTAQGAEPGKFGNPLLDAYYGRRVVKLPDGALLSGIPAALRDVFVGTEVVCVPLTAQQRCIGVILADNAYTRAPIDDGRIQLLNVLALVAGLALDNARIYKQVERQAQDLQETLNELRSTHDQLIHSERLATIGAVVARVSHEIRNPLATIGGFGRSIRLHPDDTERVARNAAIIVDEVEKLETLLKEMLDFTSPRPPALEPTAINSLVNVLTNIHHDQLAESGVRLELDLASDLPAVLADRNQVQRVFLNLWQNALDAIEENQRKTDGILSIRTWREGDAVKIAFADTGAGIPPEARPHLFTPFFTTKPRGTGLGLAVIKKILDDHQGEMTVDSQRGAGTTFTIRLPIGGEAHDANSDRRRRRAATFALP